MVTERHIVAMGGGGFSMEPENPLLDDYVLALTGQARPRLAFLATATGDSPVYVRNFYAAFTDGRADPHHVDLFGVPSDDVHERLLSSDAIYVGGGNTANMLAVWRVHGVDRTLREAWERGVVLAGVSAGMLCWFKASLTDSFGPVAPLNDGLALLDGSACPHYDGEADRRPTYVEHVRTGALPSGLAADDGAALHFAGQELHASISSRPNAGCYRVERRDGDVVEESLETRYLGESAEDRSAEP